MTDMDDWMDDWHGWLSWIVKDCYQLLWTIPDWIFYILISHGQTDRLTLVLVKSLLQLKRELPPPNVKNKLIKMILKRPWPDHPPTCMDNVFKYTFFLRLPLSDIHKAIMRLWKSFISMTSFISAQFYSHKDLWYVTKTPVCRVQTIEWFRKNLSSCVLGKVELQQPRHHHEPSDKESNSNKEMFLLLLSLFHRIFTRVGYTNKSNQTIDIFLCL